MNIEKSKYKSLKVLDRNQNIHVRPSREMLGWMKDSISYDLNDISHQRYLELLTMAKRDEMRGNIIMVSDTIQELAAQNYERMVDVLREDWIKPQTGAMLHRDGTLFTYHVESIPEEARHANEITDKEQCRGIAVLCHYDKKGILLNCTFCSSRIDYEGDGSRKIMYDCPYGGEVCVLEFSPLLVTLAFLQYADVETVYVNNGQKKSVNGLLVQNSVGTGIRYYDSRWLKEIIRTEGFKVRGHFRMQNFKTNGEWQKKLIYINEFQKHGYHRRAGKQIAEQPCM